MRNLFALFRFLKPNQGRILLLTACLLGLWCIFSLGGLILFGKSIALSFFLGGLIHSGANLVQSLYYFFYRGASAAPKMLSALGWGLVMKFLLIIILSAAVIYFIDSIEPSGLIFGIVLMHLLNSVGNILSMR